MRNDFIFNEKFYLQIKGTAMGKRFAPAYANLYMANWEEEALTKCVHKPLCYLRYLDDIFGIWTVSATLRLVILHIWIFLPFVCSLLCSFTSFATYNYQYSFLCNNEQFVIRNIMATCIF